MDANTADQMGLRKEGEKRMVRPEGGEPPTYWFVASCSIQLSYGRTLKRRNRDALPCISVAKVLRTD